MNIGDKLTWAYRSLFILMLIWLRFIEAYIPFWGIWIVWGIIVFILFYQPFSRNNNKKAETKSQAGAQGGEV
jgi:hypothetical protein